MPLSQASPVKALEHVVPIPTERGDPSRPTPGEPVLHDHEWFIEAGEELPV
jgi:hypothetical protein